MAKVITALLDLSVSRLAETMDVLCVTYTTRSGRPRKVIDMKQRRAIPADQKWRQMQLEALPTIGRICREGRVSLCRSTELSLEAMKGTYRGGNVIGDLLGGVTLVQVPCAIDRSKFQQMDLEQHIEKTTVVKFCKLLLRLDSSALAESPWLIERFTDSEVTNLRNLERFRTLCATLAESQYPDAFHLWTAEVNRLDYFLTADRAFINVMTKTARVELTTKPVAPRDLLDDLGIPVGRRSETGAVVGRALSEGKVLLYQTLETNTAAMKIAQRLGYEQYARHVAVRLRAETPSNPALQRPGIARR